MNTVLLLAAPHIFDYCAFISGITNTMSMQAGAEGQQRVRFQDTCVSEAILYCSDLAYSCNEHDLRNLFLTVCPHGVRQTRVYRGRNDQPMGYAFVELFSEIDVDAAVMQLNAVEIFGRAIMYIFVAL